MSILAVSGAISGALPEGEFRKILQLNGTNMALQFNTAQVLTGGDSITVDFDTLNSGALQSIIGTAGGSVVDFDAADLLQLAGFTATVDGVAIADGADISSYVYGGVHRWAFTATAPVTVTHVFQNGLNANYVEGHVLDVLASINAVSVHWPISNGSITIQYPAGETSGNNFITYLGIAESDWSSYRFNALDRIWDWRGSLVSGAYSFEFTGTATTPTTVSISTLGANKEINWEGLHVDTSDSHTYAVTPDGVLIRGEILIPSTLLIASISGQQLAGDVPIFTDFTTLISAVLRDNKLVNYQGSVIPASINSITAQNNLLTEAACDLLFVDMAVSVTETPRLVALNTGGTGNAALSAVGLAAKAAILAISPASTLAHN